MFSLQCIDAAPFCFVYARPRRTHKATSCVSVDLLALLRILISMLIATSCVSVDLLALLRILISMFINSLRLLIIVARA